MMPLSADVLDQRSFWDVIFPSRYDKRQETHICGVLNSRDKYAIRDEWTRAKLNVDLSCTIANRICDLMRSPSGQIIPDDRCFIVLRMYEKHYFDGLEVEQLFVELEEHLGIQYSDDFMRNLDSKNIIDLLE